MSDATEAVQWLNATGTLDQIARDVLAPAIAAALDENARAAGYAAGVKDGRDHTQRFALAHVAEIERDACAEVVSSMMRDWADEPAACEALERAERAIRARSDAQEVKP